MAERYAHAALTRRLPELVAHDRFANDGLVDAAMLLAAALERRAARHVERAHGHGDVEDVAWREERRAHRRRCAATAALVSLLRDHDPVLVEQRERQSRALLDNGGDDDDGDDDSESEAYHDGVYEAVYGAALREANEGSDDEDSDERPPRRDDALCNETLAHWRRCVREERRRPDGLLACAVPLVVSIGVAQRALARRVCERWRHELEATATQRVRVQYMCVSYSPPVSASANESDAAWQARARVHEQAVRGALCVFSVALAEAAWRPRGDNGDAPCARLHVDITRERTTRRGGSGDVTVHLALRWPADAADDDTGSAVVHADTPAPDNDDDDDLPALALPSPPASPPHSDA